jgi:pilus assembly protein CpaC
MFKRILILSLLLLTGGSAFADSKVTPIKPLNINVDHGINLTLSAPATSVFIANPDIADVQVMSPTSIMIFGKRTGETSFMASDHSGHALEQRTIRVNQDLSDLRQDLNLAIPGNKIRTAAVPNGIVLTGEAKDAATIADAYKIAMRYLPAGGDIINRVHVIGSNQIHIRVRFAEVSRKVDNVFGIDWNSAANFGGFAFGIASGAAISRNEAGAILRPNNPTLTLPNDVLSLSHVGARTNINNLIDALAQDGLVTILAEPNLTAMSGETASFLAGGEIPVPIPQSSGGGGTTLSIEWKNYGVSLEFTPTLIGENRISLHVKPEVSQLSSVGQIVLDNITIPALLSRKAETTVEVASGQSFAIAGLLDNQQAQTVNKFPILGDLPVLGNLFRSSEFQNNQSELVVIITPYVVAPNGEQMALPMDGLTPPTEKDRLWNQRYSGSDPTLRPISGTHVGVATETTPQLATLPTAPSPAAAPILPVEAPAPASTPVPLSQSEPASPAPVASAAAPATATLAEPSTDNVHLMPVKNTFENLTPQGSAPSGPGGFLLE